MSPDGPDDKFPPGPSLDPSGRIVDERQEHSDSHKDEAGSTGTESPAENRTAEEASRFAPPSEDDEPLELEQRERIEEDPGLHPLPEPPPGRSPTIPLGCVAVVALVAIAIAGVLWFGKRVTTPGVLSIQTIPSGAEVIIDGVRVGRTPYATDNRYRIPAVSLELRHRGYLTWRGTFRGLVDQRLAIQLLRAPTHPPVQAQPTRPDR